MDRLSLAFSQDVFQRLENRLNVQSVFDELRKSTVWIRFDELKFESCIGRGSFGIVFSANLNDSQVAVKLEIISGDLESKVNSLAEIYALSLLSGSSFIVQQKGICLVTQTELMANNQLMDMLQTGLQTAHIDDDLIRYMSDDSKPLFPVDDDVDDDLFIRLTVLGLCSKGALRECISSKRLPLAVKCGILLDACRGLNELHVGGMIHRDIKTTNILVNEDFRGKLCDFDSITNPSSDSSLLDYSHGTMEFSSPETILGQDQITDKSDVFSVGVILAEIITCKIPGVDFLHRHPRDLFQVNVAELNAELKSTNAPDELIQLCLSCLDGDMDKRPFIDGFNTELQEVIIHLGTVKPTRDDDEVTMIAGSLTSPDREGTPRSPRSSSSAKKKKMIGHHKCLSLGWLNEDDDDVNDDDVNKHDEEVVVTQEFKVDVVADDDDDDEFKRSVEMLISSHADTLKMIVHYHHHKEQEEKTKMKMNDPDDVIPVTSSTSSPLSAREQDVRMMMKTMMRKRGFKTGSSSLMKLSNKRRDKVVYSATNRFQEHGSFPAKIETTTITNQSSSSSPSKHANPTSLGDYVDDSWRRAPSLHRSAVNYDDDDNEKSLTKFMSSHHATTPKSSKSRPISLSNLINTMPETGSRLEVERSSSSSIVKRNGSEKWKRMLNSSNVASLLS